ncbi:MAG TPA: VOC family protein [Thermoanaerobaculia bacterium]|nr:VOC family protein [Thermoanaerobaculia bacterium]
MPNAVKPIPEGYSTVTPYLMPEDADRLIRFLQEAFDAELLGRHESPDGRMMHASLQIGDSKVMMGEAAEEWPAMPAMLHLYVEDVDAVFRQAIAAGGRAIREPEDQFYGDRSGGLVDPAGNQWWITTHIEDVSPEEMERRMAGMSGAQG